MWLPPSAREREAMDIHKRQIAEGAIRDATAEYWTRELRKIDPNLALIKANENAQAVGLKPGYWHVMRAVDNDVTTLLPVVGDDGEYVEPTGRLLEMVKAGDLQNEQAMRARQEFDRRRAAERERDRLREREERKEEMAERLSSMQNVSVGWRKEAA